MFGRHYYWCTPQPDILQVGEECGKETIPNPAYLAQLLGQIGLPCKPVDCTNGAQIATYHFALNQPKDYAKVARSVKALDAALRLDLHETCTQAVSDHASFAVQVCKNNRSIVTLAQAIQGISSRTPTSSVLGVDDIGRTVTLDISSLPHMLIAGATGSGKSVALNTIICSMLFSACPTRAQFVMIDPKQVELSAYTGLPHLACPIVTSPQAAIQTLYRVNLTMDARYKLMAKKHVKTLPDGMPRIIVVINELADLMITSKRQVEQLIIRIAQLGPAAGIHLIIATQKPVVSVVTGLIQGNIPCKLALQTASVHDSVRILGHKGAEQLLGRGDALLKLPDRVNEIRIQCAYTSDRDVEAVVDYWRTRGKRKGRP